MIEIIGSVASIVGALWAFWEARKASKNARIAVSIRNQLVEKKVAKELNEILYETKQILFKFSKYRYTDKDDKLRGINPKEDAISMQNYLNKLVEHNNHFNGEEKRVYEKARKRINSSLDNLITDDLKQQRKIGKEIIEDLNQIISLIKHKVSIEESSVIIGNKTVSNIV